MRITLIYILFIITGCHAQTHKSNDLADENLKGKIKLVRYKPLKVIDTSDNKTKQELRTKRFNSKNRIKVYMFNKDGNFEKIQILYNDGEPIKTITYKYLRGLRKKAIDSSFSTRTKVVFWNFEYDDKNNLIEIIIGSEDGNSFKEKATCEYDSNGNRIISKQYVRNESDPNLFITYEYDKFNNLLEEIAYKTDSTIFQQHYYEYDNHNRIKEEYHYTHRGMPEYLSDNSIFIYNENNDVIKELRYYPYGSGDVMKNWTFEYVYDRFGNWIEKKEFYEKKLLFIKEREIEYY